MHSREGGGERPSTTHNGRDHAPSAQEKRRKNPRQTSRAAPACSLGRNWMTCKAAPSPRVQRVHEHGPVSEVFARCLRGVCEVLCSRRTCETSTERILMKVTAMESARRRLHDQATQRGRARAVQTGAEQKESRSRVWAIIRMGDNWVYWSTV